MKKKIIGLLILLLVVFMPNLVYAATLSISASSTTITNGDSVNITVKASGLAGKFSITSSNDKVLSGGISSEWLEDQSKTYKFTSKGLGEATITIKPLDAADLSGNTFKTSKSITVKVVKPREKSTNNNLKNLSVEGYSITPEFDKDTLEYTVSLESNIEKIKINATKEDSYASVNGTGEKSVVEGDNIFEIVVTPETGTSKTYKINAIVKDSNPINITINSYQYTLVKRASILTKPDNFEDAKVTINDTEVPAFTNEVTKLTLIGLKDTDGNTNLYKYDSSNKTYSKYETLTSKTKTIIFENTDKVIKDFSKVSVTIDDKVYEAYQNKANKDYILIYGMDLETGSKNWYLYNIKEQSIQTYMSDIIDGMNNNFDSTLKEYKTVLLGMAGLSLILLTISVTQIVSKNKLKQKLVVKETRKQK